MFWRRRFGTYLLHKITTFIIVAMSLNESLRLLDAEEKKEAQCRPNIVIILADDKYESYNGFWALCLENR